MQEGGWLIEVSDRLLIRVTMPEGYRRLMTALRDLKENFAESFTGLVSQVSSLIVAAADYPDQHHAVAGAGDLGEQRVGEHGLAGAGAAGDEDVLARRDGRAHDAACPAVMVPAAK